MSRLGVWLADSLNRLIPPQAMHVELNQDKLSVEAYQEREYAEGQRVVPEFGPHFDLRGRRLLDVGSGLGGKPALYADLGAREVVGLDLRPASVRAARSLAERRGRADQLRFVLGDAARMPFGGDSFDAIISVNVLEHVDDLAATLAECRRVLRPGGHMFLHFPPFYSPWGAHLEGWVNFPWPHAFFSDRTLIEVARRAEERQRHNTRYIAPAQVNWSQLTRLPELNRARVSDVLGLIKRLDLEVLQADLLPFGRHYLSRQGPAGRAILGLLNWTATWPGLREYLTTKMAFVLRKKR